MQSFISVAVMLDESKRINEDGSWDKYWERKNRKKRKEQKDEKTTAGYCRKNLWSFNRD